MKAIITALFLCLTMTACESETQFGKCIGVMDEKDPNLTYKVSVRNAILGLAFFQVVVPPVIVLANETYCPVGSKK